VHWFKECIVTAFAIEFIVAVFMTTLMLPVGMIEGRVVLAVWAISVLAFALVYLLFYDKSADRFRFGSN